MNDLSASEIVTVAAGGHEAVFALSEDGLSLRAWLSSTTRDRQASTALGASVLAAGERPVPQAAADTSPDISLVAEAGVGYLGQPGLDGSRNDGSGWAPRFGRLVVGERSDDRIEVTGHDPVADLDLTIEVAIDSGGLLSTSAAVTNRGTTDYRLDGLRLTVPVPDSVRRGMSFTGRWSNEFLPENFDWPSGTLLIENRRGRTSHDRFPAVFVGTGAGAAPAGAAQTGAIANESGEVWGFHLAWSGNSSIRLETLADGRRVVQCGELLLPGEVVLAPGETYQTPELMVARSTEGLNGISDAFHAHLRGRPGHPSTTRPVHLNTWEAVYFNHDLDTLSRLAERAAQVGVERFVLDDGWFHGRRSDNAGLGDWWVDEQVWPHGLTPLIEKVTGLGMEFGLWVEPEMVNPDSDLYREHPDWALTMKGYEPVLARNQLVLDLVRPEVQSYLLEKLTSLIDDNDISYLKWDMNRDLIQPGHDGRATVRGQVLALYDLLDHLRDRFPGVEIESCSSGGARIDAEILKRTHRFWTSDCNDALDRQRIQRGFSHLFPPEVMGAHIGPPTSHTTGRTHRLDFRAATALFGHFGFEWNLLDCTDDELKQLGEIVETHKRFRPLLHSGRVLRFDHADPAILAHAVVRPDRAEALVSVAQVETARSMPTGPLVLTGLDPDRNYHIELVPLPEVRLGSARSQPAWLDGGASISGQVLATIGLQLPVLWPESALVLHLRSDGATA